MTDFAIARDDASAEFFDAAAEGTLLVRRCPTCSQVYAPHHHGCGDGSELEWVPAAGTASLVTWAVEHSPPLDPLLATPDGSSTILGVVELDEGPWMHVPIVGVDPSSLRAGTPMAVSFVTPGGGEAVPAFTTA